MVSRSVPFLLVLGGWERQFYQGIFGISHLEACKAVSFTSKVSVVVANGGMGQVLVHISGHCTLKDLYLGPP